MTSITSQTLQDYLSSHSFSQITNSTALIAVVFLIFIIIERELVRMSAPHLAKRNAIAFAIISIPMIAVFAAIILMRFFELSY